MGAIGNGNCIFLASLIGEGQGSRWKGVIINMDLQKKNHDSNPSGVVFLQRVDDYKITQARQLRTTMTPAEGLFWEHVRANRFMGLQFRRQQIIEGFIADFYCNKARCVVEVDG